MAGRSIRIFLADGTANGIMTAEIMNWTGKVLVAPRAQLANLAQRSEPKRTGVYVLAGDDARSPLKEIVYIGESDNVLNRLKQHNDDPAKDFWTRTILIISKDENLTKAHVRYLESRLILIATQAERATISNGTAPETPSLPEADVADMEFFLEQLLMLLPVLNFSFAIPAPKISVTVANELQQTAVEMAQTATPTFAATGTDYEAEAQEIDGQFIVLKGSKARKAQRSSLGKTYLDLRAQLREDGRLMEQSEENSLIFTSDVAFSSPSGAANVIYGTAINGRDFWKVKGTVLTYNQWDKMRIDRAESAVSSEA